MVLVRSDALKAGFFSLFSEGFVCFFSGRAFPIRGGGGGLDFPRAPFSFGLPLRVWLHIRLVAVAVGLVNIRRQAGFHRAAAQ